MWTLVIMLHAINPNVPASKGSILLPTTGYENCLEIRDKIKRDWSDDRYRVSANCITLKSKG